MTTEYKWDLGAKLTNQVKAGDVDAVAKTVKETFQNMVESGTGSLEEMKLRTARVLTIVMRAAYDAGANPHQLVQPRSRSLEHIIEAKTIKQLASLVEEESVALANLVIAERETVEKCLPQAVAYVREHATDGVTRADVADILDCSPRHVSRLFSRVLGKHFKEFVLECRIDKSKQRLTNTNDKIIDIALAMGFSDQNYFSTCFKRLTGVTPGQYRKSGKLRAG